MKKIVLLVFLVLFAFSGCDEYGNIVIPEAANRVVSAQTVIKKILEDNF